MNEKIYIFIWFWLLFLGFLSSLVIVYRIVIVFSPYIRAFVLRLRYRSVIKSTKQAHFKVVKLILVIVDKKNIYGGRRKYTYKDNLSKLKNCIEEHVQTNIYLLF